MLRGRGTESFSFKVMRRRRLWLSRSQTNKWHKEKLRRIVREVERERAGFGPSKAERESSKQPVGKCVREYIQTKRGQHCDERLSARTGVKAVAIGA